ncbi:ATPase involved in DNA repair [Polymorphum gilvum SL003B-26A1]|uniref:ATPase involved in DNA repair n=2 Tax=Polymorphum TaxID=991903 RepID=F2IYI4_POLGS|nr:ATPase involved in DNA repair [Polymorphum gilvum SL003B-26A1]
MGIAAGMGLALTLGGCESVSKDQCLAGDWVSLGRADGAVGRSSNRIEDIVKDCGRHGVTPDPQAYLAGWNEGVQIYCTPANGFNVGRQGSSHSGICPPALAGSFEQSYRLGYRLWSARSAVEQVETRIRSLESRIASDEAKLRQVDCARAKPEAQQDCRNKAQDLRNAIQDSRFQLQDARWSLLQKQAEYQATEAAVHAEASVLIPGYGGQ